MRSRVRRALKKQAGGWISVPVARSNKKLKLDIKESIASGKFDLGIEVLESEHKKLVLTTEGSIEKKSVKTAARKYPLKGIAKKSIKNNQRYLRCKYEKYNSMSEEEMKERLHMLSEKTHGLTEDGLKEKLRACETNRNWLTWHDHSSIAGSGFMLFMVREMYDPAVYLTSKEYKAQHGQEFDIQSIVETPHLYMMGAAGAKDVDQLEFVPTRQECLKEFTHTEVTNDENQVNLNENMRFMNGDTPAIEYEDGTQKGGHYACSGCQGDMRRASEYDYMSYQKYLNLEEKQHLVISGKYGNSNAKTPFKNLKVNEIKQELKARKKSVLGTKKELQERLTGTLRGTSRVPALLFGPENYSLKDLNITNYEVLFFEPLHTCLNHINNIITELPLHMTNIDALITFKEITSLALHKDKLRATDYRRALLKLTIALTKQDLLNESERDILLFFCEMMGMYYENDDKRSPKSALRLHNISFKHGRAVQDQLTPPKAMSLRKLCGIYYHTAVDHAPFLYRLVCLRSIGAELFERFFDRIEDITRKTWNKQIQDLVPNALLHVEAEDNMATQKNTFATQEKEISHLATGLPKPTNTVITKEYMMKHSSEWQSHLSKIPDYLLPGPNEWWKWRNDGAVEFLDIEKPETRNGPPLYPFRSNSIKDVKAQLHDAWEQCIASPASLPLYKLRDSEGKLIYQRKEAMQEIDQELEDDNHEPESVIVEHAMEDDIFDEIEECSGDKSEDGMDDNVEDDDEEIDDRNVDVVEIMGEWNVDEEEMNDRNCDDDQDEWMDVRNIDDEDEMDDKDIDDKMDDSNGNDDVNQNGHINNSNSNKSDEIVNGRDDYTATNMEHKLNGQVTLENLPKHNATQLHNDITESEGPPVKRNINENEPVVLKSKTAKAIEAVLGLTKDVIELDQLKAKLVENPKSYYYSKSYQNTLTRLQTQVLRQLKATQQKLDEMDVILDKENQSNQEHKDEQWRKKIILKLLESWKITVHL